MIVIKEVNEQFNIIHLIIGPETDLQFDIAGYASIPIDDKIEKEKPNIIHINRCLCNEQDLLIQMDHIFSNNNKRYRGQRTAAAVAPVAPSNKIIDDKYGTYYKELKCPGCHSIGTYVKNGEIQKCLNCFKIDDGIEKITPMTKEEEKILSSMIENKKKKNKSLSQ